MIIYIARHGDAEPFGAVSDAERSLTENGLQEVERMALHLQKLGESADRIVVSPFKRAMQTAQVFQRIWNVSEVLLVEPSIKSGGDVGLAKSIIESLPYERVLAVSHMPLVAQLSAAMIGESHFPSFKTGTVVKIVLDEVSGRLAGSYNPGDTIGC